MYAGVMLCLVDIGLQSFSFESLLCVSIVEKDDYPCLKELMHFNFYYVIFVMLLYMQVLPSGFRGRIG